MLAIHYCMVTTLNLRKEWEDPLCGDNIELKKRVGRFLVVDLASAVVEPVTWCVAPSL